MIKEAVGLIRKGKYKEGRTMLFELLREECVQELHLLQHCTKKLLQCYFLFIESRNIYVGHSGQTHHYYIVFGMNVEL